VGNRTNKTKRERRVLDIQSVSKICGKPTGMNSSYFDDKTNLHHHTPGKVELQM
jgi:hypothetical protein